MISNEEKHPDPRSRTLAVTTPRFDDERTVQSARRVVPLEKVNAKSRRRLAKNGWALLSFALAGGMLIRFGLERREAPPNIVSAVIQPTPSALEPGDKIVIEDEPGKGPEKSAEVSVLRTQPLFSSNASAVRASASLVETAKEIAVLNKRDQSSRLPPARSLKKPVSPDTTGNSTAKQPARPVKTTAVVGKLTPPRIEEPIPRPAAVEIGLERRERTVGRRNRAAGLDEIFRIEDIFKGRRRRP